jgi:proteic killer suppression protein
MVTLDSTNAWHYYSAVIKSFRDKETERVWKREYSKRLPRDIQERALMKLQQLNAAGDLKDLSFPSSNQLETLKGNRRGEYSIRVNKQWRICFKWRDGHASDVEITDYH